MKTMCSAILLASLASASFTLTAADTPPLDLNAPLQIQLWSGPEAPDAFATKGPDGKEIVSQFFGGVE